MARVLRRFNKVVKPTWIDMGFKWCIGVHIWIRRVAGLGFGDFCKSGNPWLGVPKARIIVYWVPPVYGNP